MEADFFNQYETAYCARSGLTQAGAPGKLWSVVKGLMQKGMNPLTIINLIHTIMDLISQFNTLSVEEIIQKVLALFNIA